MVGTANVAVKKSGSGLYVGTDGTVYVQATDVHKVKVFTASGALTGTLPYDGPFPQGMTFRGPGSIYLADGSYLDASHRDLVRRDAGGSVVQTYISGYAPPWTGMALDPDGTSFWACDESCYVYHFDIASGNEYMHFWASQDLGGLGVLGEPRLLELTVSDHNNPSNTTTAIDAAIQQMYVPEDETTQTAEIDISTLFDPGDATNKIHLRVECTDDGELIVDDNVTSLDQKLMVYSEPARNFVITAWLDRNGNGQLDAGDDKEEVDVHVVKPWTAQGTWTAGHAALVKANADGASQSMLEQLALDITGHAGKSKRGQVHY